MSGDFQKRGAGILASIIIGLIILSFMFTGYNMGGGNAPTTDTVALVGDQKVSAREYRMAFAQRIQFYRQIFGGKDLTSKQIEQFGIKKSVLQSLVQTKLLLKFADDIGIHPSKKAIAEKIRGQKFFNSNDRFDLEKYKGLLAQNGLTPAGYEKLMAEEISLDTVKNIFQKVPVSSLFVKEKNAFAQEVLEGTGLVVSFDKLQSTIPVSNKEISDYISKNGKKVSNLFERRKKTLVKKERVKARHILWRLEKGKEKETLEKIHKIRPNITVKNFAKMANKHTQDPSGKNKGGSLGWFEKGKMVPQFEKVAFSLKPGTISPPVKTPFGWHIIYVEKHQKGKDAFLKDHQKSLAKELVQKSKQKELEELKISLLKKIKMALNSSDSSKIKNFQKKYSLEYLPKTSFSRLDKNVGSFPLTSKDSLSLFKAPKKRAISLSNASSTLIFYPKTLKKNKSAKGESPASEFEKEIQKIVIEELKDKTNIRLYNNIL